MKTRFLFSLLATLLIAVLPIKEAIAQDYSPVSQMNYRISSGYHYPNEGTTSQLDATIDYNDTTGVINSLDFEVYLFSFQNRIGNGNILAWLGAADYFPNMSFESRSVEETEDELVIKGTLYFRGRYSPVTIQAERRNEDNVMILDGRFTITVSDYIMFVGGRPELPTYVNMDFNMIFPDNEVDK